MKDFIDDKVDIWHWNVNGVAACFRRMDWPAFLKKYDPTIICLNETKCSYRSLDGKKTFSNIPQGYD